MHHRILGLSSTLAFLFVAYAVAWFSDPSEISFVAGKPDSVKRAFEALALASIFTLSVLFIIVWPQTLLASWIVRRFRAPRFVPFALFLVVSNIIVWAFIFMEGLYGDWFLRYLMFVAYFFVPCLILWRISFRHEPVA